jgi:hypothetical protein
VKKPQALVPSSAMADIKNTGRFPQAAAAAAEKKVPAPVVSCIMPTMLNDIWSAEMLNVEEISSKPVVIMGPSLQLFD